MEYVAGVIGVIIVVAVVATYGLRRITAYAFERGLKYVRGKFRVILTPGQYWYWPWFTTVRTLDVRPRFASITGQEVLSSDGVTLKVSLAANYEIENPDLAINKAQDFQTAMHLQLQLALRQIIGAADIDTLLATRDEMSRRLAEVTEAQAHELGLRLISVGLKDIMFPGKLKEVFAQVVSARKEGLAALEKARGETAALRNLANAAQMIESNPGLMQLRMLQTLGGSSGNTLVLGLPSQTTAIPLKSGVPESKEIPPQVSEES
jgi:regulator of protease activity HflC (stomatin/prohibitin superfamily)